MSLRQTLGVKGAKSQSAIHRTGVLCRASLAYLVSIANHLKADSPEQSRMSTENDEATSGLLYHILKEKPLRAQGQPSKTWRAVRRVAYFAA